MEHKKLQDTKPFCMEHAKAGAPFCGDKGQRLVIMAWHRNHPSHPIVGMEIDGEQEVVAFRDDGETDHNCGFLTKRLVMTPLGYIDGKPVFVGDEIELKCQANPNEWKLVKTEPTWAGTWNDTGKMARWPVPAKVYPETRMTGIELVEIHERALNLPGVAGGRHGSVVAVANAALRHAIDAGQVVTMEEHTAEITHSVMKGQDLANDEMRADYKQQSVDLGKAERLLESMGFRSVGNGDWQRGPSPVKCFYGHPKKGLYVEGDKASIDKVRAIVERDEARDMAIAEAVSLAWQTVLLMNAPGADHVQLPRMVDLTAVIAKVPS